MLSGRAWMCSRRGASSGCIRGAVTLEHSRTGSYDWRGFTMNHPGMSGDFLGGLESCQHSSRRYPPDQRERAVRMVAAISDQHDSEWAPSVTWSWARARASRTAAATMRWLSTLNNSKFGTIWGPQMPREQVPSVRHGLGLGVQILARYGSVVSGFCPPRPRRR